MKRLLLYSLLLLFHSLSARDKYFYTADLKNIVDDKVNVELLTPAVKEQRVTFPFQE